MLEKDRDKYIFNPTKNFSFTLEDCRLSPDILDSLSITDTKPTLTFTGNTPAMTVIESPNVMEEIKEIWARLNRTVSLVHNCQNCGAKLEIEENKPVFHCKYCGSTYLIGAVQPHSRY